MSIRLVTIKDREFAIKQSQIFTSVRSSDRFVSRNPRPGLFVPRQERAERLFGGMCVAGGYLFLSSACCVCGTPPKEAGTVLDWSPVSRSYGSRYFLYQLNLIVDDTAQMRRFVYSFRDLDEILRTVQLLAEFLEVPLVVSDSVSAKSGRPVTESPNCERE